LVAYYCSVGNDAPLNRGVFPDYPIGMSATERLQKSDAALNLALQLASRKK
jgi:hypothetical protein